MALTCWVATTPSGFQLKFARLRHIQTRRLCPSSAAVSFRMIGCATGEKELQSQPPRATVTFHTQRLPTVPEGMQMRQVDKRITQGKSLEPDCINELEIIWIHELTQLCPANPIPTPQFSISHENKRGYWHSFVNRGKQPLGCNRGWSTWSPRGTCHEASSPLATSRRRP